MPPKGRYRLAPPRGEPPKRPRIPNWYHLDEETKGAFFRHVASYWKANIAEEDDPKKGSFICFTFTDDLDDPDCTWGLATPPPPPQTLGLSPITCVHTEPAEPTSEALGFSPIHTALAEEPSPPPAAIPAATPRPTGNRNKKRKGKMPSSQDTYALKRQLSDKEAEKIASAPPVNTPQTNAGSVPATTPRQRPPTPTPKPTPTPEPTPKKKPPHIPKAKSPPPTTPDANTPKTGIVVHGIALRKDLGNIRRWMEAANQDLGKIKEIQWLRKKITLIEEGKKTSSVVVYLEEASKVDRVRLGGRWLRAGQYEWDRGRK